MGKQRLERRDAERASLEAEFRDKLIRALEKCAAGRWGLFAQNAHIEPRYDRSPEADELIAIGESIEQARRTLGIADPFELYSAFKDKRGRKDGNALGEARLAQAWLTELKATS